ncbi:hypothetical protein [Brevibacillus daliensis]|uniref:hypothetical protein n=1 Tax=Brevibacillus daliensis TaxID=2892995 RepID=UPI001E320A2E|nr:hypothetical protein [Brevibacillus daliensis]
MNHSAISLLWMKGKLPMKDGIYFADGRSIACSLGINPHIELTVNDSFSLQDFLVKSPFDFTTINILNETYHEDNQCFYTLGKGSNGSEGFVASLAPDRRLIWVAFFANSESFVEMSCDENILYADSSSGVHLQFPLHDPELCSLAFT